MQNCRIDFVDSLSPASASSLSLPKARKERSIRDTAAYEAETVLVIIRRSRTASYRLGRSNTGLSMVELFMKDKCDLSVNELIIFHESENGLPDLTEIVRSNQ
jgi:hypothetical protein